LISPTSFSVSARILKVLAAEVLAAKVLAVKVLAANAACRIRGVRI
jgi:hypothetical protein